MDSPGWKRGEKSKELKYIETIKDKTSASKKEGVNTHLEETESKFKISLKIVTVSLLRRSQDLRKQGVLSLTSGKCSFDVPTRSVGDRNYSPQEPLRRRLSRPSSQRLAWMEVDSVDLVSTVGLANFSLTGFFPSSISSGILETKLSRAVLLSPGIVFRNLPGKE